MELLEWLQDWCQENCYDDLEHRGGVKIFTLANPGWAVLIDLVSTSVENKNFEKIKYDNSDLDWMTCSLKDGKFDGSGDANKLMEILTVFKNWVEE